MYHDQENTDDLKLKGLNVSGGFTTPPNYFSHLQTHILNRTSVTNHYESGIPEGYFERSRSIILQKTVGTTLSTKPLTIWYQRPLYKYMAAAAVIVCFSVVFWLPRQTATSTPITALSDEEILHYLERSDLRDINIVDVNFAPTTPPTAEVEQYIISQSEEQLLLENL